MRRPSPLSLNFASAQRNLTGPRPYLGFGLLLAGALVLAIVAWKNDQQAGANAALRAERDQLTARVQRQQPGERVPAELSAQFDQAAAAYAQITTAWDELFRALEASKTSEIALLSLTADAIKMEFSLSGEAKDFGALSKFSDALSASPVFRLVTLSNHKLSEGAPPIVVKFDLMLVWRPDSEPRR
jgi:Tfp pilus assembly protein PilN